jgi:Arc/MetJ-type ribon-helix-helix transcriptional regulator
LQLWNLPKAELFRNLKVMEVQLTPDQKAFVRQAIQSGRLHREEDAVQEALALWEERERTRAEILVAVDEAEASLARGEGRIITQQSMRDLAGEVKQRGRDRLAPEAEAELDDIWCTSPRKATASRLRIAWLIPSPRGFFFLPRIPTSDAAVMKTFAPLAQFPRGRVRHHLPP